MRAFGPDGNDLPVPGLVGSKRGAVWGLLLGVHRAVLARADWLAKLRWLALGDWSCLYYFRFFGR